MNGLKACGTRVRVPIFSVRAAKTTAVRRHLKKQDDLQLVS